MNNSELMHRAEKFATKNLSGTSRKMINADLPPAVLSVAGSLDDESYNLFINQYNRKKLDRNFGQLFALLSIHYAYMGKVLMQLIFWMTAGGLGFWYIFDLFSIQKKINKENEFIALEALDEARSL